MKNFVLYSLAILGAAAASAAELDGTLPAPAPSPVLAEKAVRIIGTPPRNSELTASADFKERFEGQPQGSLASTAMEALRAALRANVPATPSAHGQPVHSVPAEQMTNATLERQVVPSPPA